MRDVLAAVASEYAAGRPCAVATVVRTWRSAPRPPGAAMAVTLAGEVIGSVSGGCVEGAVYEVAQDVLAGGPARSVTYGVSDDEAFAVGLTCGGVLEVLVARVDSTSFPALPGLAACLQAEEPAALATVVAVLPELPELPELPVLPVLPVSELPVSEAPPTTGPPLGARLLVRPDGERRGSLGSRRLDDAVADAALGLLAAGSTGTVHVGRDGERRRDELTVLVESFAPRPRMYVFGAIDFAAAVVRLGRFLGYRVTVCDARPVFATAARFPEADEVVVDWPHRWLASAPVDERTVMCVLTHDPKFDVPLLACALRTPAAYIGAMGSRRTHEARLELLRAEGLSEAEVSRLASPIGLDLGGRTPEETAVSIAAEIVAARWGGSGRRLSGLDGPIHAAPARPA